MDSPTPTLKGYYRTAQRRFPEVLFHGDLSRREIALTFDDGPHPQDTPRLLEVLDRHQVQATFHLVGRYVEHHPDLVRQIHRNRHQLALHCYRHIPFPLENPSSLRAGLDRTQQIIAQAAGIAPAAVRDVRTPYGIFTSRTVSQLTQWGYRMVMWTSLPPHWMQPVARSIRQVMESAVPGAVIVLHDGNGHGRRVAEIVDAVVPRIQSLGIRFITVDDMHRQRAQAAAKIEKIEVKL
jgi:peptidoglycan/xylan/chitin deacetylase (PgdA/CDA1 family)